MPSLLLILCPPPISRLPPPINLQKHSQQSLRALSPALAAWVAERASSVSPEVVAIASVYFVQGVLARLAVTFLLKDDFGLDPAEVRACVGVWVCSCVSLLVLLFWGSAVSPKVVVIAIVYFVQGMLGLARLAVTFLLKDDFGLDPAEVSASLYEHVRMRSLCWAREGLPRGGGDRECVLRTGRAGLARLAVTFLLKDDFGLDPAELRVSHCMCLCALCWASVVSPEVAVLSGLSSLPWLIKPIYGFISDGIPLFGYRPRSYLVACGLLGYLALLNTPNSRAFPIFSPQVAVLSGLSSLPWLIKPIYGLISDGIPLFGYRRRSYLVACGLLGSVAWGALASVVFLWETIRQPAILLPTAFIFLWQATPHSETAMFFFT
ncbi:unnamed protein product [Closterium sp. Naga37s-1]|nr:unnamed protein product [Closterium sp. Naga37s-1]